MKGAELSILLTNVMSNAKRTSTLALSVIPLSPKSILLSVNPFLCSATGFASFVFLVFSLLFFYQRVGTLLASMEISLLCFLAKSSARQSQWLLI